jgi:hypothetical protein
LGVVRGTAKKKSSEDDRGGEVSVCGAEVCRGAATTAAGTGEVEVTGEVCGLEAGCGIRGLRRSRRKQSVKRLEIW